MTPTILGISAFYHDSAAAIVRGGDIIAAARKKDFRAKNMTRVFRRMLSIIVSAKLSLRPMN